MYIKTISSYQLYHLKHVFEVSFKKMPSDQLRQIPTCTLNKTNYWIIHEFPFFNICKVPSEPRARGFQHFQRDLANVNSYCINTTKQQKTKKLLADFIL